MKNSFTCTIEDMTCGGCVKRITQAIIKQDENAEVVANLELKTVSIQTQISNFSELASSLELLGYSTSNLITH